MAARGTIHVEVYKGRPDRSGKSWRWVAKSANGKKVGPSGQAFYNYWTAKRSALRRAAGEHSAIVLRVDPVDGFRTVVG